MPLKDLPLRRVDRPSQDAEPGPPFSALLLSFLRSARLPPECVPQGPREYFIIMSFESLGLVPALLKAVEAEGYKNPTPIQQKAIPEVLAGRDLLGCAQTGTGKTAAFALPVLQHLSGRPRKGSSRTAIRALVLAPTRELATQIGESFRNYGANLRLFTAVIFGGVGYEPQRRALRRGTDILVATPGRLEDLMEEGIVNLGSLEILVLDEADRMLDMGFIHAMRRILRAVPKERQTLFFSATMPKDIQQLAREILKNPAHVEVAPESTTAEKIAQSVYMVPRNTKQSLLHHLLKDPAITRALVFTRTKHGADRVARNLERATVPADVIHGNRSQSQRQNALERFRTGRSRVLVATDIAARGIDVEGVSHVFNFDLPNVPEDYVHRIGRTARAGASGLAVSFCDGEERDFLRGIEKTIRMRVPVSPLPSGMEPVQSVGDRPVPRGDFQRQEPRRDGFREHRERHFAPRKEQRSRPGHRPEGGSHAGQRSGGYSQGGRPEGGSREHGRQGEGHRGGIGSYRPGNRSRGGYRPR